MSWGVGNKLVMRGQKQTFQTFSKDKIISGRHYRQLKLQFGQVTSQLPQKRKKKHISFHITTKAQA